MDRKLIQRMVWYLGLNPSKISMSSTSRRSYVLVAMGMTVLTSFLFGISCVSVVQRRLSLVLSRSEIVHYISTLPDPDFEINGNNATAVLMHSNVSYTTTRLSKFDHSEGIAFYNEFQNVLISGNSLKLFDGHIVYFPGGCDLYNDPFPLQSVRDASQFEIVELDNVLVLSQYWGGEYYHWMIEGFPRLALMLDYLESHPHVKLLVYHHPIAETLLGLLDFEPDRIIWYKPWLTYFVRNATCPSPSFCGKGMSTALPLLKRLIRQRIQSKHSDWIATKNPKPYTIVVQSRGDSKRSLTNHNDLMRQLRISQHDAQVVEFGPNEDSISTIVKHFNADIIIGPHGAGLSNIIFAPHGATVLELHPDQGNVVEEGPHHVNGCHQRTAKRSGLQAIMLLEDNGDPYHPFRTNISRVVDAVDKIRAGNVKAIDCYASDHF